MGEVLGFGFNLVVSFPSDIRSSKARIVLLPSRIKRWGLYILLEFIPLHHVIFLNALLYSYELNTLDAGMNQSMCGVIVVDAELFRSIVADVIPIYMIMPRYSHNYALFYQLLDSNLFTHRNTCYLERSH